MNWQAIVIFVQLFFGVVIGLYFWNLLKNQRQTKTSVDRESKKEVEKLRKLRSISLTRPLAEKTRPSAFEEIIGQKDGCARCAPLCAVPILSM